MIKRKYESDEPVRVGDVVQLFDGSYGTAIVTRIENRFVTCDRAYTVVTSSESGVDAIGQWGRARVEHQFETVTMPEERFRKYDVYVTGVSGKVENRA